MVEWTKNLPLGKQRWTDPCPTCGMTPWLEIKTPSQKYKKIRLECCFHIKTGSVSIMPYDDISIDSLIDEWNNIVREICEYV